MCPKEVNRQNGVSKKHLTYLHRLSRIVNSPLGSRPRLRAIVDEAIRITGASSGSLLLIDPETNLLSIEVLRGYSTPSIRKHLRLGEGITGWVAKTGKPVLVDDVRQDHRYIQLDPSIKSELAVPIILKGRVIGILNVNSRKVGSFSKDDVELLSSFATHSAQIIDNNRLYREGLRQMQELKLLIEMGKNLTETPDLDSTFRQVVAGAARLLHSRVVSLMLLTPDREEFEIKAVYGGSPRYINRPNLKVKTSFIGRVVRDRKPVTSIDVRQEKGYQYLDLARQEGLCSLLSVPLLVRQEVIGVINAYKSTRTEFTPREVRLLSGLADLAAVAIEKSRLYERIFDLENKIRQIEKLGVIGELAREFAHEFRNPLTIVKMLAYSLSGNGKDCQVIMEEINRMNRIIDRFLNFGSPTKIDQLVEIDVNQLIVNTLELLSHRIDRQGVKVRKNFRANVLVRVNPDRISQLFLNLFINALDVMEGGGQLTISNRVQGGREVEVWVSDTGPGVPESIRERIFQPFVTTKEGGTGLGLTISRRIAEEHGGKIKLRCRKGKGTTFVVSLPIAGQLI